MKRSGLTLIELLVVIVVLTVLMSILVPGLKSSRKQAQTLICSGQIKQITMVAKLYTEDENHYPQGLCYLPECLFNAPRVGNNVYDWGGFYWFHYLNDILGEETNSDSLLWCPSRQAMEFPIQKNLLCGNYGANYAILKFVSNSNQDEFRGKSLKSDQIRQPSQTILFVDSGYTLISWKAVIYPTGPFENSRREGSFYLPGLEFNQNRILNPNQQQDAEKERHLNHTVNVGFVDGRVSREYAEDLTVEMTPEGPYNSRFIWSPEYSN